MAAQANLWIVAIALLASTLMGSAKKWIAWVERQKAIIRSLIVVAIVAALWGLARLLKIDIAAVEIPTAALYSMAFHQLGKVVLELAHPGSEDVAAVDPPASAGS